jgi:hypothetical protein
VDNGELALSDLLLARTASSSTIQNNSPTITFSGSTFIGITNDTGSFKVADIIVTDIDNDDVEYKIIYGLSGSLTETST